MIPPPVENRVKRERETEIIKIKWKYRWISPYVVGFSFRCPYYNPFIGMWKMNYFGYKFGNESVQRPIYTFDDITYYCHAKESPQSKQIRKKEKL